MSLLLLPVPRQRQRTRADRPETSVLPQRSWSSTVRNVAARSFRGGAALAFSTQVVVVAGLVLAYHFARALADGKTSIAFDHSSEVWHWERAFHLPSELSLQHWVLHHPTVAQLADYYYMGVHFPFTGAVLIYLYFRRRDVYRSMRNVLVLLTASGLALAFLFPLAPPRMRGDLGFTDVARTFGQSVYGPPGTGTANQFAAMPSLHVGWAVLVGFALVAAGRSRWRWLWLAHPAITVAVVVGTANHYWADGIVGTVLLVLAAVPVLFLHRRHRFAAPEALVPAARDQNHPFGAAPSPRSGAQEAHS